MQSLGNNHSENLAGIYGVMLALVPDVASFPELASDYTFSTLPVLKPGTSWGVLEFTEDTGSYAETPKRSDAGNAWQQVIQLKLPKRDPDSSLFMATFQYAPLIGVVCDRNGMSNVIGTIEKPARIRIKQSDTNEKIGDFNFTSIEIYATSRMPAPWCAAVVTLPPPPPRKVFNNGFTFGFLRTP